ncbi:MAG: 1-(5-phosphoribosyl)-5-[(5-phosphoribosylamino)methylideneamino]imidazole-4-carboxamide isomerase [Oscillospiraceae bacterium]|nr:1-(5-phosphoribosyl)-5-[(5-phosphoribosylamino)methylideneamino]imidazole-4-carboxamide isomerase [Oscillospiraceae bacterium]
MTILPAIDLFDGKAVRLRQGDYQQMTIYSAHPWMTARAFKESGAEWIHIVDLEGARDGVPKNSDIISRIVGETGLKVEVGGGIRTVEVAEEYLNLGVSRVILGTAAVASPGFVEDCVSRFGDAVAVSVDMKDGKVATSGWTEVSDQDAISFCRVIESWGVQTLICTDISKDGLLQGTNIQLYQTLREQLTISIIASGGITGLDEIRTLCDLGVNGAILGKAIFTGALKLTEAIKEAAK